MERIFRTIFILLFLGCSFLHKPAHAADAVIEVCRRFIASLIPNFGKQPQITQATENTENEDPLLMALTPKNISDLTLPIEKFSRGELVNPIEVQDALSFLNKVAKHRSDPRLLSSTLLTNVFTQALRLIKDPDATDHQQNRAVSEILRSTIKIAIERAKSGTRDLLEEIVSHLREVATSDLRAFREFFNHNYLLRTDTIPPSFEPPEELMELLTVLAQNDTRGRHTQDIEILSLGFLSDVVDRIRVNDEYWLAQLGLHNVIRVNTLCEIAKNFIRQFQALNLPNPTLTQHTRWAPISKLLSAYQYDRQHRRPIKPGATAGEVWGFSPPITTPPDVYSILAPLISEDKENPVISNLFTTRFRPPPMTEAEVIAHYLAIYRTTLPSLPSDKVD